MPLQPSVRRRLEHGLGRDLGHVRVHDDAAAHGASSALSARAFTHRHHIWLGQGESASDLKLLAHEATHVVQQGATTPAATAAVTHAGPPAAAAVQLTPDDDTEEKTKYEKGGSSIDTDTKKVVLKQLKVPTAKARKMNYPPFKLRKSSGGSTGAAPSGGDSRGTSQRKKWDKAVKGGSDAKIDAMLEGVSPLKVAGKSSYYLKSRQANFHLIGTRSQIKGRARRPSWNRGGTEHSFDVDHIQEHQLSGPDDPGNYWLWDASANRSSGSKIANEVDDTLSDFLSEAEKELGSNAPTLAEVKGEYESVTFEKLAPGLPVAGAPGQFWEKGQITRGAHTNLLRKMTEREIETVRGSETQLSIFTSATGGQLFHVPWGPQQTSAEGNFKFYDNFEVRTVTYTPGGGGTVTGVAFRGNRFLDEQPITATLSKKSGVEYGGYVSGSGIESQISKLKFKPLSPIEIEQVSLESGRGLIVRGRVMPTVPLIKNVGIELSVVGNDVTLSKTFTASDFDFPGPIQVSESSLRIGVGGKGLEITGDVLFEVEKVGQGEIRGAGGSSGDFSLSGKFDFDTELFDQAEVTVNYKNSKLDGKGTLTVAKGKLRGIESASIEIEIQDKDWRATGEVTPEIPAVSSGTLSAAYKEGEGLEIGGKLDFSSEAPAIKGGSITVKVMKGDGGYKVHGSGSADLDIPGIDASVDATYDDGAFDASAKVGYKKGLLDGSLKAGVKKESPDAELIPYGSGTVTLKIAPWLQGTAGINILPSREIEVKGKVSLPDALEIFPEKKVEKELLSIGVDIPIVGVSVAGQRIGIFANITGSLGVHAGIGPGKLDQLSLEVFYNPSDESATTVTGKARFVVPADAGVRLSVRGSLGAGIPVVSAQLGLEVGGELGVEGEAKAGVTVSWTPSQGIDLEAEGEIKARPKLTVDLTGFALVEADIVVDTIELYRKNWALAKKEIGSNLEFGISFPIHYREGQPFNISLSDVEFTEPEIEPSALLKQLIDEVV
ncbi:MAG: DUF4157 domain-containing protein [Thermoanaerobaculia bacterium]|nr:DUF4157 domain-containing protein [Thermoanaerobaculia bacterium]